MNIADFVKNTAAYKGKSMTLRLQVNDAPAGRGQALREHAGRDVRFTGFGPRGERLNVVISVGADLCTPEVGKSDEVMVTFVCTRGSLRHGNVARSIEMP